MSWNQKNPEIVSRAEAILAYDESRIFNSVDWLFATLILLQWTVAVAAALWMSPDKAECQQAANHHSSQWWGDWAATSGNGFHGARETFHPPPGRIRTDAHGGSADLFDRRANRDPFRDLRCAGFLSLYRDWRVLVTASIVTLGDQFMGGGILWTQSVNGLAPIVPLRCLEQIGCVLLTDFFLFVSIWQSRRGNGADCRAARQAGKRQQAD